MNSQLTVSCLYRNTEIVYFEGGVTATL